MILLDMPWPVCCSKLIVAKIKLIVCKLKDIHCNCTFFDLECEDAIRSRVNPGLFQLTSYKYLDQLQRSFDVICSHAVISLRHAIAHARTVLSGSWSSTCEQWFVRLESGKSDGQQCKAFGLFSSSSFRCSSEPCNRMHLSACDQLQSS